MEGKGGCVQWTGWVRRWRGIRAPVYQWSPIQKALRKVDVPPVFDIMIWYRNWSPPTLKTTFTSQHFLNAKFMKDLVLVSIDNSTLCAISLVTENKRFSKNFMYNSQEKPNSSQRGSSEDCLHSIPEPQVFFILLSNSHTFIRIHTKSARSQQQWLLSFHPLTLHTQ